MAESCCLPSWGTQVVRPHNFLWPALTVFLSLGYLVLGTAEQPPQELRELPDTASHAGGYGLLAFATAESARVLGIGRAPFVAATYAVAHGVMLEALQSTTRTRQAESRDVAWDAAGSIVAIAVWSLWRRRA